MITNGRVVWKEGLFLHPQHLQQAQRYAESLVHKRMCSTEPYAYGLLAIEVDTQLLAQGAFGIHRFRAVMPDGTLVESGPQIPPPVTRSLAEVFKADTERLNVYLALTLDNDIGADKPAPASSARPSRRYRVEPLEIGDETGETGTQTIEVAYPQCAVRFEGEGLDGCCAIQIARLIRSAGGVIELDRTYFPPMLRIGACEMLVERLRRTLQTVIGRTNALTAARGVSSGGAATFASGEEYAFMFLQTLMSYAPMLAHYCHAPVVHPWELYRFLNQFCGALCAFSSGLSIADFPRYAHDDLAGSLGGLLDRISALVEVDMHSRCVPLSIQQSGRATYVCTVSDERLLTQAKLFVGVSAPVAEKELVVGALQRMKLASRERLDILIASALPGVQLVHVPRPPEGLAVKPSFVYFAVNQQGELWDGVRRSGSVALHFPADYPELKVEMLALRG